MWSGCAVSSRRGALRIPAPRCRPRAPCPTRRASSGDVSRQRRPGLADSRRSIARRDPLLHFGSLVLPGLARAGLDHFHLVTSLIQPTCPRLHGRFRVTHLDHFGWIELGICRPDCEWACRIVFNHAGILPRGRVCLQSAPRNQVRRRSGTSPGGKYAPPALPSWFPRSLRNWVRLRRPQSVKAAVYDGVWLFRQWTMLSLTQASYRIATMGNMQAACLKGRGPERPLRWHE